MAPDDLPVAHKALLSMAAIFDLLQSKRKFRELTAILKKAFTDVRNSLEPSSSLHPVEFCVLKLMGPAGFNGIPAALFEREQRCSPAVLPSGVALKLLCLWGGAQQPPPAKLSEIDLGCVDLIDLFRVGSKDQSLH